MSWRPPPTATAQRFTNTCFQSLAEEGRSVVVALPRDLEPGEFLDRVDAQLNRRGPTDMRLLRLEADGSQLEENLAGCLETGLRQLLPGPSEPPEPLLEKSPVFVLLEVRLDSQAMPAKVPQELDRWLDRSKAAREAGAGCRVLMCVPALVREPKKLEHVAVRRYPAFSADEFSSDLEEILDQLLPPQPAHLAEYTRLCLLDACGGRAQDLTLLVSALEKLERSPEVIAPFARNPWNHPELVPAIKVRREELQRHRLMEHCVPSQIHQGQEAPWLLWLLGASRTEPHTASAWTLLTARSLAALALAEKPRAFILERCRAAEQALVSCFNYERRLRITLVQLAQTPAGDQAYRRALGSVWEPARLTAHESIRNSLPERLRAQDPLQVATFGQLKRLAMDMCQTDRALEADLKRAVELRNGLAHNEDGVGYEHFEWLRILESRWDRQLLSLRSREPFGAAG